MEYFYQIHVTRAERQIAKIVEKPAITAGRTTSFSAHQSHQNAHQTKPLKVWREPPQKPL